MYSNSKNSVLKHLDFILLDIVVLQLSYCIAYMIRHGFEWPYANDIYFNLSLVLIVVDLFVMFFTESYRDILHRGFFVEFKSTVTHVSLVMVLLFVFMFFWKNSQAYSRVVFLGMWAIAIVLVYIERVLWKSVVRMNLNNRKNLRNVVLITSHSMLSDIGKMVVSTKFRDYQFSGIIFMDGLETKAEISGIPVVAQKSDALIYLKNHVVDEVFVNIPVNEVLPQKIISGCAEMGITLHLTLDKMKKIPGSKTVEEFAGYTVLTSSVAVASDRQLFMKRSLDIVGGVVGTILMCVLFLFVAPVIYIKSPGPIFFTQTRVGKNGRKFKLYKFRSMYMDAEERKKELMTQNEMDGFMFKMKDDPRIIKGIGHFIRKTSIDEFPQFLNVLKGDMSLVGTRPPTESEYEHYDFHHKKRLAAKPGITGLWQISGRSDITNFEDVVKLDMEYIENWTLGTDLRILLKTVKMVVRGEGAA